MQVFDNYSRLPNRRKDDELMPIFGITRSPFCYLIRLTLITGELYGLSRWLGPKKDEWD